MESAENKKQLADVENKILQVLSSSQGNILEDEYAIKILGESKIISNEVATKQEAAEVMEVEIDEARQGYVPVAFQGAVLFFVVADMGSIDPMSAAQRYHTSPGSSDTLEHFEKIHGLLSCNMRTTT